MVIDFDDSACFLIAYYESKLDCDRSIKHLLKHDITVVLVHKSCPSKYRCDPFDCILQDTVLWRKIFHASVYILTDTRTQKIFCKSTHCKCPKYLEALLSDLRHHSESSHCVRCDQNGSKLWQHCLKSLFAPSKKKSHAYLVTMQNLNVTVVTCMIMMQSVAQTVQRVSSLNGIFTFCSMIIQKDRLKKCSRLLMRTLSPANNTSYRCFVTSHKRSLATFCSVIDTTI